MLHNIWHTSYATKCIYIYHTIISYVIYYMTHVLCYILYDTCFMLYIYDSYWIRVTRSLVLCVYFSIFKGILLSLILANLCVSEIRCRTGLKASNHLLIIVSVLISFLHLLQTSILLTTQWPNEKVQKDKQRSTKHTHTYIMTHILFYIFMTNVLCYKIKGTELVPVGKQTVCTNWPPSPLCVYWRNKLWKEFLYLEG
jgi:hypothetical protein